MAEAFQAFTSALQLVEVAIKLTKLALEFKDAPNSIREAATTLSSLKTVLSELESQCASNPRLEKLEEVVNSFETDLTWIATGLQEYTLKESTFSAERMSTRKRFAWVTYGSKEFEKNLANLSIYMTAFTLALGGETNKAVNEGFQIMLQKQEMAERHLENMRDSLEKMKEDRQIIHEMRRSMTLKEEMERRKEIEAWLASPDYTATHESKVEKRTQGTGEWFLREPIYEGWKERTDAQANLLWCHGVPGAGKSFITSIIIDDLKATMKAAADSDKPRKMGLAYIYCNYKEQEPDAKDYLAAVLKQLIPNISPEDLLKAFKEKKASRPTLSEVVKLLQTVVKLFDHVYVVIDALDECRPGVDEQETRRTLVEKLKALDKVSLLVTSRPNLAPLFEGSLKISISAHDDDLRAFIKGFITVQRTKLAQKLVGKEELQDTIVEKVLLRSDKMFLLANLLLKHVNEQHSLKRVVACLERLPNSLDDVYSAMIGRIGNGVEANRELGMQVLSWIALARRELTVPELCEAIAASSADPNKDDATFDRDDLIDEEEILAYCEGLVTMDDSGKVRFIHKSLQEFLLKRTDLMMFTGEGIAFACIRYLSTIASEVPSSIFDVELKAPELEKNGKEESQDDAAQEEPADVPLPDSDDETGSEPLAAIDSAEPGNLDNSQRPPGDEDERGERAEIVVSETTVEVGSRLEDDSAEQLVTHDRKSSVLEDETQINQSGVPLPDSDDEIGSEPLAVTDLAEPDNLEISQRASGEEDESAECVEMAASETAAEVESKFENEEILDTHDQKSSVLLEEEAQTNPSSVPLPDSDGECQLELQEESIVESNAETQSDQVEQDKQEDEPENVTDDQDDYELHRQRLKEARQEVLQSHKFHFLSYAAHFWGWHVQNTMATESCHAIQKLVQYVRAFLFSNTKALRFTAIAVDSLDEDEYDTSFHVGLLAEEAASPLHIAAWHGLTVFVGEALFRGFGVDLRDIDGNTALHIAACDGMLDVVKFLVKQPNCAALVCTANRHGMSPLQLAARYARKEVLLHLLPVAYAHAPNFDVNAVDPYGFSLLRNACWDDDLDTLKQLFKDPNLNPNLLTEGYDPVLCTMLYDRTHPLDVLRFLIAQKSLDINAKIEGHNQTALHIACAWATDSIVVKWILERPEVDVNAVDGDGDTPIAWAAEKDRVDTLVPMLERDDVQLDWRNKRGLTVLDWVRETGKVEHSIPILENAFLLRELPRNYFPDGKESQVPSKEADSENQNSQQQNGFGTSTQQTPSSASIGRSSMPVSGSDFGSSSWSLFSDLNPSTAASTVSHAPSHLDLQQPFRTGLQRSQTYQQNSPIQRFGNQQQNPFSLGKRSMSFGQTMEAFEPQSHPATINMMSLSSLSLIPAVPSQTEQGPSSDPTSISSHHFGEVTKDGMRSQPAESSANQLQHHPSSYFKHQHTYPRAGVEVRDGDTPESYNWDVSGPGEDPVKASIQLMVQMRMQMRRMQKQLVVNQRRMMRQFGRNANY